MSKVAQDPSQPQPGPGSDPAYPPAPATAYPPPPPNYGAPPPGYGAPPPPAYGAHSSVVVVQQPYRGAVPGGVHMFGQVPALITCQFCQATVTTTTTYSVGSITWVACAIICFIGLWLGCCLIPFCINSCKDVIHTCPNCHGTVGRFRHM